MDLDTVLGIVCHKIMVDVASHRGEEKDTIFAITMNRIPRHCCYRPIDIQAAETITDHVISHNADRKRACCHPSIEILCHTEVL